jgi:hypothetical protein
LVAGRAAIVGPSARRRLLLGRLALAVSLLHPRIRLDIRRGLLTLLGADMIRSR